MSSPNRRYVGKRPCSDCQASGTCRRRVHHQWGTLSGEGQPSHDAYGNPYSDHVCCGCKGAKVLDCYHEQGLAVQAAQLGHPPVVSCFVCGFKWLGVPYQSKNQQNLMFDVLCDTMKELFEDEKSEAKKLRALAVMEQFLEWHQPKIWCEAENCGDPGHVCPKTMTDAQKRAASQKQAHRLVITKTPNRHPAKRVGCSCGFEGDDEDLVFHFAYVNNT